MVHCLPTVYVRQVDASAAEKLGPSRAGHVARDLDWLEGELKKGSGRYLVGDHVSAADTMVAFLIQFIFWLRLAPQNRKREGIEAWLRNVEAGECISVRWLKLGTTFRSDAPTCSKVISTSSSCLSSGLPWFQAPNVIHNSRAHGPSSLLEFSIHSRPTSIICACTHATPSSSALILSH